MIIQHYHFAVRGREGAVVYEGDAYFGFFSGGALANQVGIRDAKPYAPAPVELARATSFDYPAAVPFPDTQLRMIDRIDASIPGGGPHGNGFIRGLKRVFPDEWFFRAHFYQDPVWPGSLGLEAFLQLLKVAAAERWGATPETAFESAALGVKHAWVYRGQVVPDNELVAVEAVVTAVDDEQRLVQADGLLSVDGREIYQMTDFAIRMR
jgi:3-hydroxymyristoyl/3-hydroxydecanoyl-(acyl carrier protein) dehydratase